MPSNAPPMTKADQTGGVNGVVSSFRHWWGIGGRSSFAGGHPLGGLGRLLDRADVHERRLRQLVPLPVAQLLEAADRVLQLRELARLAGERLGDEERLREEPLDPAGPGHHLLVVLAQLLDAEDG